MSDGDEYRNSNTGGSPSHGVSLETTLRGVSPNPELEYFVEKRARQLDSAIAGRARCTVVVQPRRKETSAPHYEVDVRVVGETSYAHSNQIDPDPLLAVRDAFDAVHHRLARQSSGVRIREDATSSHSDTDTGTGD